MTFLHRKIHLKVFTRFFISYLLVLVLPIIMGSFAYQQSVAAIEKDAKDVNIVMLKQISDILDRDLKEVNDLVFQLALNYKIKKLLYKNGPIKKEEIYEVRDAWRDMGPINVNRNIIQNIFIYFKDSDLIISPDTPYSRMDIFYGPIFQFGDLSFQEWQEQILHKLHLGEYLPTTNITYNNKKYKVITYARSIPIEYGGVSNGMILVFIDENKIHDLMKRLPVESNGWVYIADEKGNIITSMTSDGNTVPYVDIDSMDKEGVIEREILGRDMIVVYNTSSYNNWTYVAGIPSSAIMAKAKNIKVMIWVILSIALLVGFFLIVLMAYQSSRPIKNIIRILMESEEKDLRSGAYTFDFLKESVLTMVKSNVLMQDTIDRQMPFMENACLSRLLQGEFDSDRQIKDVLEQTNMQVTGSKFIVFVAYIHSYSNIAHLRKYKQIVREKMNVLIKEKHYSYDVGPDKIAFLVSLSNEGTLHYKKVIENATDQCMMEIDKQQDFYINWVGGCLYDRLKNIHFSFNEAMSMLQNNIILDKTPGVIWFDSYKSNMDKEIYYYPIELELRLINFIKAGEREKASNLLEKIYDQNFGQKNLSFIEAQDLMNEISGTVIKIKSLLPEKDKVISQYIEESIKSIKNPPSVKQAFKVFNVVIQKVCDSINEEKKSHNQILKEKVLKYINLNYQDSNLSLSSISEVFHFHGVYLSQFFKEQVGENFSSYLEGIRLQHANELLEKDCLSIKDIAIKVGYNNAMTFRRAYKRRYGISPTDYKKKEKQENIWTEVSH